MKEEKDNEAQAREGDVIAVIVRTRQPETEKRRSGGNTHGTDTAQTKPSRPVASLRDATSDRAMSRDGFFAEAQKGNTDLDRQIGGGRGIGRVLDADGRRWASQGAMDESVYHQI